jgi:hypothetical protein
VKMDVAAKILTGIKVHMQEILMVMNFMVWYWRLQQQLSTATHDRSKVLAVVLKKIRVFRDVILHHWVCNCWSFVR